MSLRILLVLAATVIWFGGSTWYYSCKVRGFCGDNARTALNEEVKEPAIPEEGPLVFNWSKDVPVVDSSWFSLRDSLLAELGENQELEITGFYFEGEPNADSTTNLGLLRALRIKEMLADVMDTSRVKTRGILADERDGVREVTFRGTKFQLLDKAAPVVVEEFDDKTLIFFPYKSDEMDTNEEILAYLNEMASHLQETGKTLLITGHTDNIGGEDYNVELGRDRANRVLNYLLEKGVNKEQVAVDSKGKSEPITSNNTEEGRRQNRRVEFRIQ